MPDEVESLIGLVRAHGAVVIAGAGLSHAAGFPLASHLPPLLWHAFDAVPEARLELAQRLRVTDAPAKELIAHDGRSIAAGYDMMRQSDRVREAFQRAFAARDATVTRSSPAQEALARLYHAGVVELLVSFNWDTGIERAYENLYGRRLVPQVDVYKPHGDAAFPHVPWILPDEAGYVPSALVARVRALVTERPRVLVIVGYSESDATVVEALVGPLASRWIVCRIAPNAYGSQDIAGSADDVLPQLAAALVGESWHPAWEYVTFDHQHDLRAALSGRGLGPGDAGVCPRLPEVDRVITQLRTTGAARIIGQPGAGKSLVAYQAAATLNAEGYETVRLVAPHDPRAASMLEGLRFPTLALVDDAHLVLGATLRGLEEKTAANRAVLSVWPDGETASIQRDAIAIDPKRAVQAIAAGLLQDRQATLDAVRSLDDWVGDAPSQVPLERRIKLAVESSVLPWQFCFTVGGGWRRAKMLVDGARVRHADSVLALAAMMQIASRDATLDRSRLLHQSTEVGLAEVDVLASIEWLVEQRLLLARDDLRCPHQQFGAAVIATVYEQANDRGQLILDMARAVLTNQRFPILGVYRLLHELTFSNSWGLGQRVVDAATCDSLRARCLAGVSPEARGHGAYLLSSLRHASHRRPADLFGNCTETLLRWLDDLAHPSAFGLAHLLNDFINEDEAFGRSIVDRMSPVRLADAVSAAPSDEGAALGELLGRVSMLATAIWKSDFSAALNRDRLRTTAGAWPQEKLGEFAYFVRGLSPYDRELSLELVEAAVPQIQRAFANDVVQTYRAVRELLWSPLRVDAPLTRPRPDADGRRIGRLLFSKLTLAHVARVLQSTPRRDLEELTRVITVYHELFPSRARAAMRNVLLKELESSFEPHWDALPREFELLLMRLWYFGDRPVVEAWIREHASTASALPPHIAWMLPDVCASVIVRGGSVPLKNLMGFHWKTAASVVETLGEGHANLVPALLAAQVDDVVETVSHAQAGYNRDFDVFLRVVKKYDLTFVATIVDRLDPTKARAAWEVSLAGPPSTQRGAALLIATALETGGVIGEVAAAMRRHFPRRSVPKPS